MADSFGQVMAALAVLLISLPYFKATAEAYWKNPTPEQLVIYSAPMVMIALMTYLGFNAGWDQATLASSCPRLVADVGNSAIAGKN